MSADKPVSLAERCHVERCFCHSSDCEGLFCVDETCVCLKGEKARDPRCVALEAEAKELEQRGCDAHCAVHFATSHDAEARVEALEAVLQMFGTIPLTQWMKKRAAALAERKP